MKTRLARVVGQATALRFYRTASAAVIGRLSSDPRWTTCLAVDPDTACRSPVWSRSLFRIPQGRGDLGHRLSRLMDLPHAGPVMIVGSDIPPIRPDHIARAFRVLRRTDIVLGPALDGGYWLIGRRVRRRRPWRRFERVRWSTEHALADTAAALFPSRIGYGPTLTDVDSADDLRAVAAWAGRRVLP